jgi:thiamine biosynthesis lipoprotein
MFHLNLNFEGIGTHWQIDINSQKAFSSKKKSQLAEQIINCVENFDLSYSRFRPDSLVSQISKAPGLFEMPDNASRLFEVYDLLYRASNQKLTPLIGQTISDAGYDAEYTFESRVLNSPPSWDDSIQFLNGELKTKLPVLLDFGAAGKGYLLDIVAEILDKENFQSFCIDAGGDILYRDNSKIQQQVIQIGLEHPEDSSMVVGVAKICNQSLCASAGNRRSWGNFHHIIDPDHLASPKNILATWVVADEGIWADGLATSLFLTPAADLTKLCKFEYAIIYDNYSLEKSVDFPGEFFIE